jgi:Na+-transporting NADH:ubiquinone oxidoreductase subunit NqrB
MLLLIVQSYLVNAKNVQLHKSLGTFGIFVATGLLALGTLLTVLFLKVGSKDPAPPFYALSYLSVVAVLSFGLLFCLAIRATRRPDDHKRLMLFASINLLPPGINRLYMVSFGLTELPLLATYLTLDALAIAILAYDWRTKGRVSAASLGGASAVFLPQLLYPVIVGSAAFANLCSALGSLAYYR